MLARAQRALWRRAAGNYGRGTECLDIPVCGILWWLFGSWFNCRCRRGKTALETTLVLDHKYPSTLESVDHAEAIIMEAAAATGFDEDDQHRISMAFRECMVNAVVHGNRYNKNKQVAVFAERAGTQLTMRVTDEGEGFEPRHVPDPLDTDNLLRHSGRGLFLMGAFMDDMKVHKVEPNGTEVTLVKRVPVAEVAG